MSQATLLRHHAWQLIKPYWQSQEKWLAVGLLLLIILGNIAQVRIMVITNSWRKNFFDALQLFNLHQVLLALWQFAIIVLCVVFVFTYTNYFGNLLINRWRRWLTHHYVAQWLDNHTAYGMQILNKQMDNPDQRISEDLLALPTLTLTLFSGLFNAILTILSFSVVLWHLSGNLVVHIKNINFSIPGYMCFATLLYAGLGTVCIILIGKRLPLLNYLQEKYNANFRFGLIRVRECCEQITLYRGQENEKFSLFQLFQPVFSNYFSLISVQKNLAFFTNGYNLLTQVVGILIALPRYVSQRLAVGSLIQVGTAFEQVVGGLSFIVFSYSTIANWCAVIQRLTELQHTMQLSAKEMAEKSVHCVSLPTSEIVVTQLQLSLPNQKSLCSPLNFKISQGKHVLIKGKYGSGKSTLLRAFANAWPYGKGKIIIPPADKILFLPQKPYFPLGTLRQALLYPQVNLSVEDAKIQEILTVCRMKHLINYLDESRYWSQEFSLGEQQIIAFVRIFLYQPAWVFLDEATSALDEETQSFIYQLLMQRLPQLTIISVGHRSSLHQFHPHEISIISSAR